jgi:hypothetical protein
MLCPSPSLLKAVELICFHLLLKKHIDVQILKLARVSLSISSEKPGIHFRVLQSGRATRKLTMNVSV